MNKDKLLSKGAKRRKIFGYSALIILSIIWVLPFFYIILTSFRVESGSYTSYFWPRGFTFNNYRDLFFKEQTFHFVKWFKNTLFVAVFTCLLSSFFVLSIAYVLSRMRFRMRKPIMNIALILGMFPGFMAMIAIYHILKNIGLHQSLYALIFVYSSGAATGFYIAKGFFDTIPKALDEAAYIDSATKSQVFWKITVPLSKPIIIYTLLTSFMTPWADYIFVSVIMGDNVDKWTVALGMTKMLDKSYIYRYYTQFSAAAVIISIPIALLFIYMQKFYVAGATNGAVKG